VKAVLTTRADGARLVARIVLPLDAYGGEPITLGLEDGHAAALTTVEVGALTPVGRPVRRWRRGGGRNDPVRRALRSRPGSFEVEVIARGAFAAAAGTPDDAVLTVTIGSQCTCQAVSRKPRRAGHRPPA
jgi:hypothetical protein